MISLQNLKMNKVKGALDTKEKVRELGRNLEDATENAFKEFQKAKFKAWAKNRFIVLD